MNRPSISRRTLLCIVHAIGELALVALASSCNAKGQDLAPHDANDVPFLIEGLKREFGFYYLGPSRFENALVAIGSEAVPGLLESLEDPNSYVRALVARTLRRIGPVETAAIPPLIDAISDESSLVREEVMYALGDFGPKAISANPALVEALEDENATVRIGAAIALINIGSEATTGIVALTKELQDENSFVRERVVRELGDLGPEATSAIPALVEALQDENATVRLEAAIALVKIDREGTAGISALANELKGENSSVRQLAARALGDLGLEATAAVPPLIDALNDQSTFVRSEVVHALRRFGPEETAVFAIVKALKDESSGVREIAAIALGDLGAEALAAVPPLVDALSDDTYSVRREVVRSLVKIAHDLQDEMTSATLSDLDAAIAALEPYESQGDVPEIGRALQAMRAERSTRPLYWLQESLTTATHSFREQKWLWFAAAYVGLLIVCLVGLVVWPNSILLANDFLRPLPEAKITWPFELPISVRYLLLVGFFNYRKRALDAWVHRHLKTVRREFPKILSVEERELYVSVPVSLDSELVPDFQAQTLQAIFRRKTTTCVQIKGQGGSGKTSLACQLGKWAIHKDKRLRLTRHPMIPVLIEEEVSGSSLVQAARGALQELIGQAEPIGEELFIELVKKKRVLLIVDHLSEMTDASRELVRPRTSGFPFAAIVVTSRITETRLGNTHTLEPTLLSSTKVTDFVFGYIRLQERGDLFEGDEEFFESCRRLSRMVGRRQMTPLFAKLYLDQLINARETDSPASLPENIPDLMLRYVDELHRDEDFETKRRTQDDAKKVAWLCVRDSLLPSTAQYMLALDEIEGDQAKLRLDYLESKLLLIRREGTQHNLIRFVLDPLAEYLGAMQVVEMYKGNPRHWKLLLDRADDKERSNVRDFMCALFACCTLSSSKVPLWVIDELEKWYETAS